MEKTRNVELSIDDASRLLMTYHPTKYDDKLASLLQKRNIGKWDVFVKNNKNMARWKWNNDEIVKHNVGAIFGYTRMAKKFEWK